MNQERKKTLQDIYKNLIDEIERLDQLKADEEESLGDLDEGSKEYDTAEEIIDHLGGAIDALDDTLSCIEKALSN